MMSTTYIKSGSEFDSNDLVAEDAPTETVLKQEMKKEAQRNVYVWCWGRNKNGELSLNCSRNANVPRDTKGLKGKKIKQIVSGEKHSAALTVEGELLICGSYLHGIFLPRYPRN
jgi:alpha-tubulin suppressor-like RCC1 family protein